MEHGFTDGQASGVMIVAELGSLPPLAEPDPRSLATKSQWRRGDRGPRRAACDGRRPGSARQARLRTRRPGASGCERARRRRRRSAPACATARPQSPSRPCRTREPTPAKRRAAWPLSGCTTLPLTGRWHVRGHDAAANWR